MKIGAERREFARTRINTRLNLRRQGGPWLSAEMRDVSTGGLRIATDCLLLQGETVEVRLQGEFGPRTTFVEVRYIRYLGEYVLAGTEFRDAELSSFIGTVGELAA